MPVDFVFLFAKDLSKLSSRGTSHWVTSTSHWVSLRRQDPPCSVLQNSDSSVFRYKFQQFHCATKQISSRSQMVPTFSVNGMECVGLTWSFKHLGSQKSASIWKKWNAMWLSHSWSLVSLGQSDQLDQLDMVTACHVTWTSRRSISFSENSD